jgi:hypothetical protein
MNTADTAERDLDLLPEKRSLFGGRWYNWRDTAKKNLWIRRCRGLNPFGWQAVKDHIS